MDELREAFLDNPGGAALTHGDAHPGNFFYDPRVGTTLIDTPNLYFSMDEKRNPAGFPARDVAKLYQSLAIAGRGSGLSPEEALRLQRAFLQAYSDAGGLLTDEAFAYFRADVAVDDVRRAARALSKAREELNGAMVSNTALDVEAFDRAVTLAKEALDLGG
jgi:uncharacterized protein (DUF2252 family)